VPRSVREYRRNLVDTIRTNKARRAVLRWIAGLSQAEQDHYALEINHIHKYGFAVFPYEWARRPETGLIEVLQDRAGIPFIVRNGHNLFFPATWRKERIEQYYRWLLQEQRPESPHTYSRLEQTMGDRRALLVDVGCAEGIWAFDNALSAAEIILCEPNKEWHVPLQRTFASLGRSFNILPKKVGTIDEDSTITVDTLLKGRDGDSVAVKLDVEGSEQKALAGAAAALRRGSRTSWDICLYHNPDDEQRVLECFRNSCTHLHSIDVNPGYMVYADESHLRAPLLRRGVVRIIHEKIT
jgi:hypothetical protein